MTYSDREVAATRATQMKLQEDLMLVLERHDADSSIEFLALCQCLVIIGYEKAAAAALTCGEHGSGE